MKVLSISSKYSTGIKSNFKNPQNPQQKQSYRNLELPNYTQSVAFGMAELTENGKAKFRANFELPEKRKAFFNAFSRESTDDITTKLNEYLDLAKYKDLENRIINSSSDMGKPLLNFLIENTANSKAAMDLLNTAEKASKEVQTELLTDIDNTGSYNHRTGFASALKFGKPAVAKKIFSMLKNQDEKTQLEFIRTKDKGAYYHAFDYAIKAKEYDLAEGILLMSAKVAPYKILEYKKLPEEIYKRDSFIEVAKTMLQDSRIPGKTVVKFLEKYKDEDTTFRNCDLDKLIEIAKHSTIN